MKMSESALPAGVIWHQSASPRALAQQLAHNIGDFLRQRLQQQERASMALSGGSTPELLFKALTRQELDWPRVDVLQVDERWVEPSHPDSNSLALHQTLLQGAARSAQFFPLYESAPTPAAALDIVRKRLQQAQWPLDLVILGMGNDGHTASLFPDAPELESAMTLAVDGSSTYDRVAAITPPHQPHSRMSLTRSAIASGCYRILHIQGAEKLNTLNRALAQPDDWQQMPVRAFLHSGLHIYWSPDD